MSLNIRVSIGSLLRRIFSRRFLKFGTVGVSGTVVNLGLLYFAQEHIFTAVQQAEVRLNLSLALAIFFATVNNFFWNRLWTWADRKHHYDRPILTQFGQYTMACWLSIALQAVFTNMLAPHFYYLVANLIAIGLTSVLNFVLNDIWTFGRLKLLAGQPSHQDSSNGHGGSATENERRRVRSLSPTSDETTSHSTKLAKDASKVVGYPPVGESDGVSLRDAHIKRQPERKP